MTRNYSTSSRADRDILDQIRAKIDFVQLVSERVELKGTGEEVKGLCPFHDDKKASLSVSSTKQFFYCHGCGAKGDIFQWIQLSEKVDFKTALEKLAARAGVEVPRKCGSSRRNLVATYDYTDEAGRLVSQVLRYEPKEFRQRRPNGEGGWIWKLHGVRPPLFRLPEVLQAIQFGSDIWITEGEKDALALVKAGVCATTAAQGASAPWLDEYTETLRAARAAIIVADADQPGYEKAQKVRNALDAAGVSVRVVKAKEGKDAADHLAAGFGIGDFVEIANSDLDTLVGLSTPTDLDSESNEKARTPGVLRATAHGYIATSEGLFKIKRDEEGVLCSVPLTNVDLEILESVTKFSDDDEETVTHRLAIRCKGFTKILEKIDPQTVNKLDELLARAGFNSAAIYDYHHAKIAMHELSQEKRTEIHTELGWKKIGDVWTLLHGTCALGPSGTEHFIKVESGLAKWDYGLPDPAEGQDLLAAILLSLQTWRTSHYVMTALLGAVFRAVLPPPPSTTMHLGGMTGIGKTTLVQLARAYSGKYKGRKTKTFGWNSTGNAIENALWAAGNHIVVVDDFVAKDERERAHIEALAGRIVRGAANHQGRARLRPDGSERPVRDPRAFLIMTGEDTPGQNILSERARMLLVELRPEDAVTGKLADPVRIAELAKLQRTVAKKQLLAAGFAAYIVDLAKLINATGMNDFNSAVEDAEMEWEARWSMNAAHAQTAPAVASLAVGWVMWLDWAERSGVMTPEQAEEIRSQVVEDLDSLVAAQKIHLEAASPTDRWRDLLVSALRSGKCHVGWRFLAKVGGGDPGEAWGWRAGEPQGDRIGWIDKDGVYLLPEATHAVISKLARETGSGWPTSMQQTWKLLHQRKWIVNADPDRHTHKKSVSGGGNPRVVEIPCDLLVGNGLEIHPEYFPASIPVLPTYSPAAGENN